MSETFITFQKEKFEYIKACVGASWIANQNLMSQVAQMCKYDEIHLFFCYIENININRISTYTFVLRCKINIYKSNFR